jgi:hypothetical protein
MMLIRMLVSTVASAAILLGSAALGQDSPGPDGPADESPQPKPHAVRSPEDGDAVIARLYGALLYTQVSVGFDQTPARKAINELRAALGVPLIGRYRDDQLGYGLDPASPITLHMTKVPALDVLKEILAQCEQDAGECTWQIRKGFIEASTKTRLSVPAAREMRTYYIADVIMDIPRRVGEERKRREQIALDVIQEVVENVEPDAWDYGQVDYYDPEDLAVRYATAPESRETGGGDGEAGGEPDAAAARPEPPLRRYVSPRKIAIIRYWRDLLIIHAPDYIHREIGGYPDPIPPPGVRVPPPSPELPPDSP